MIDAPHNPNRSLIRIFCLSLSGLLFVYSTIAVYGLFQLESINAAELATGALRIALGLLALGILFRWERPAQPPERQVRLMRASLEPDYAHFPYTTTIRPILLLPTRR